MKTSASPLALVAAAAVVWGGPFAASSLETRDIWRAVFDGRVRPMGSGLVVEGVRSKVVLAPDAPAGVLQALRVDLAESTPDGSWRIVREGEPVGLGMRFAAGETRVVPPVDLRLDHVRPADLQGRWLVATLVVSSPLGHAPLAHAHMDFGLARAIAARAVRAQETQEMREGAIRGGEPRP